MNKDPRGLIGKDFKYGKYCGGDWTGGLKEPYDPNHENQYAVPETPLDGCCRLHDIEYYQCRKNNKCNKKSRKQCMMSANHNLLSCAGQTPFSLESYEVQQAMTIPPGDDLVGPNDPSCKCGN